MRQGKARPFCLFLSWGPPHTPFKAPKEYDHYRDLKPPPNVPRNKYAKEREQYYGLIEAIDVQFGRLMAELDKLGLADSTIVVYTSDHGEMMGAHGDLKKYQPFTEASQVPLIVRWPGRVRAGLRLDAPIGVVDLFPTLAGLAGIGAVRGPDGTDRSAWLTGKAEPTGEEAVFLLLDQGRGTTPGPWRGVRTARYNYARLRDRPFVLFDLQQDPYEMSNLVAERPELVKKFDEMTLAMMKKYDDRWPPAKGE
jgi:arylsulfatase A-like enzyme